MNKDDENKDKPLVEVDISHLFEIPSFKEGVDYFYYHINDMTDDILNETKDGKTVFVVYDDYADGYDYYEHASGILTSDMERCRLCIMQQWPNASYDEMKVTFTMELDEPVTIEWQPPADIKRGKVRLSGDRINSVLEWKPNDEDKK